MCKICSYVSTRARMCQLLWLEWNLGQVLESSVIWMALIKQRWALHKVNQVFSFSHIPINGSTDHIFPKATVSIFFFHQSGAQDGPLVVFIWWQHVLTAKKKPAGWFIFSFFRSLLFWGVNMAKWTWPLKFLLDRKLTAMDILIFSKLLYWPVFIISTLLSSITLNNVLMSNLFS